MSMRTAVTHQAPAGPRSRPPEPIPMDAWREDDRFVIALDVPGIPQEEIDVEARGRMVAVRTERRRPHRGQGTTSEIAERPSGVFERRIQLADTLDVERIQAQLADGVLTLTVPVASAARPRKITVRSGRADQADRVAPAAV